MVRTEKNEIFFRRIDEIDAIMNNYNINENTAIGLIPARGGSKSIPLKNIVQICGRPLISYVIDAGKRAISLAKLYCSTDHDAIAEICKINRVEIIRRPDNLCQDDTPVVEVVRHAIDYLHENEGAIPGMIALLQPTSPFLTPGHINDCVEILKQDKKADSSQTIAQIQHNHHAFNQRIINDGYIQFRYLEERRLAYNKQRKPKHYIFGNLVVSRSKSILNGKDCFGDISIPLIISRNYTFDLDTKEDVEYAAYLIKEKKISLE